MFKYFVDVAVIYHIVLLISVYITYSLVNIFNLVFGCVVIWVLKRLLFVTVESKGSDVPAEEKKKEFENMGETQLSVWWLEVKFYKQTYFVFKSI